MASVHEGKKNFKCVTCNAGFLQKDRLNTHMVSVHEGFDLHLSLVHGEKIEIKVESPICEENLQESQISEKKFSYKPVHEKEKAFKCNVCYASFAQNRDLKGHTASVHEGNKPFQCNICDVKFTLKSSWKNHKES